MKDKSNKPGYGKLLDAWVPPDDAGEPIGCVATSFTFKPAFFEEECLGRFLQLESNADEDGPAYLVEREEKMKPLVCATALVDQHHAHGQRSLRWDLLPARPPRGSILHAKVSLLLWSGHARLIVASANLTEAGYRSNHEVFAALDFFDGGATPRLVLDESIAFLREAVRFAQPADGPPGPAIERWLGFLERVTKDTRAWGATESSRGWVKPRVGVVFTGPDRPSAIDTLRQLWPEQSLPNCACVVSPFFDDPANLPNEPARKIWDLLKLRGPASVEYHVTAEASGENVLLVHAPDSLKVMPPGNRAEVRTLFRRLALEEGRPLHAKCLWLENDRFVLHMIGSSNFTSAGLGLGKAKNLEANLAFVVSRENLDAATALENAWLPVEEIRADVELLWKPRRDEDEDTDGNPLLPDTFGEAAFGSDTNLHAYVRFTFAPTPPLGWALFPEDDPAAFVTEADWQAAGRPSDWKVPWSRLRPPYAFRVSWQDSVGFAWWPVNVVDSNALPPPDGMRSPGK